MQALAPSVIDFAKIANTPGPGVIEKTVMVKKNMIADSKVMFAIID